MLAGAVAGALMYTAAVIAPCAWAQETAPAANQASELAIQNKLDRTRELLKDSQGEKGRPAAGASAGGDIGGDIALTGVRVLEGLLLCLGVLALGVYIAKRFGFKPAGGAARKIKLIERTPLSSRTALVLAEIEGKTVLISVGAERVSFFEVRDAALFGDGLNAPERGEEA